MLSEDRVRAELHRIANGIEVNTDAHLAAAIARTGGMSRARTSRVGGSRRRRYLAPLAAAAAVAGLVVAGTALTGILPGGEPEADKPAPVVLAGTPDGTVPSVFGHTRESASGLLRELGLDVRYGKEINCDPAGRPVGTEPVAGTPLSPGETVTVLLSYQGATTDCFADLREPWRFLDFATGRGPSPRFADEVGLFVDGVRTGTLSGADAARGDWGANSALSILGRGSEQVLRVGDSYLMPQLQVTAGTPPDTWCGIGRPRDVADREALTLTIDFADVTAQPRCPAKVALYETAGAIDAVVAWSESARGSELEPIPDVVGLSLTEARDRVTAAGYPARIEKQEACHPRRGVVEQAPIQQDLEEDREDDPGWRGPVTLVVEVPHTTRDCAGLDAAASAFLRFARGGPPPTWAPEVQQLLGYAPWATVTAAAANDPASWSLCSGVTPQDCEVSPLVVAGRDGEVETGEFSDVTRFPQGDTCELIDLGGLPNGLPVEKQIVLYPVELTSCDDDWSVWLWIDDEGRITTVNLLVPER
ncbi:PASTA domain-containing protein [Nocardioides sp.]|uniref:PASTA domain-containing protein n=1 Tax=Nocardioides sp. TaxID=35761 RepID=UPI00286A46A5|nr:PASTA domain-containing protein [Nocardioides sp.]